MFKKLPLREADTKTIQRALEMYGKVFKILMY